MTTKIPQYLVVKDTREQQGYFFGPFRYCDGMVERKIDTGDYTIEGLEGQLCIERKASVEELALNLGKKRKAFDAEIERMVSITHKFIILEFDLEDLMDFPDNKNSKIPDKQRTKYPTKITGKYMMKCLTEYQLYKGVHVLFCGNRHNGFLMADNIMKRVHEQYTIGKQE